MGAQFNKLTTALSPGFDPDILIRKRSDPLKDWIVPIIGAFESRGEIISIYAATHERAINKKINLLHFSFYKQEAPITSLILSSHDTFARIDDGGTLPAFQRKG